MVQFPYLFGFDWLVTHLMFTGYTQGDCATLDNLIALGNSRLSSVDGHQERPTLIGSQGAGACPKYTPFVFKITLPN